MKTLEKLIGWSALLCVLLVGCQSGEVRKQQAAVLSNAQSGKALFEEKCRTVAGEKIYRTVPDVDGVLLMKLRPRVGQKELQDPLWPGAAFALEAREAEYITTFLGYEHAASYDTPVSKDRRGYIGADYQPNNPSNIRGYQYVDVIDQKDGKRYRYTGLWEEPWQYDKSYLKGYIKFSLQKIPPPIHHHVTA